jgi:hypothetical protein
MTLDANGEPEPCEEGSCGDTLETACFAGEFCSLSGVYSGVCGVRGNLLGVVLGKLGDFWQLFLGVWKERCLFQCLNIVTYIFQEDLSAL